jgi:uncharacterized membrane protein
VNNGRGDPLWIAGALALAALLLVLLYAHVFLWGNSPNIVELLGLDV